MLRLNSENGKISWKVNKVDQSEAQNTPLGQGARAVGMTINEGKRCNCLDRGIKLILANEHFTVLRKAQDIATVHGGQCKLQSSVTAQHKIERLLLEMHFSDIQSKAQSYLTPPWKGRK